MKIVKFFFFKLANFLPASGKIDSFRWKLYQLGGINIKGPCRIFGPISLHNTQHSKNIYIGNNVFMNQNVRFACTTSTVNIGDNVEIGPRVCFETSGHGIEYIDGKGRSIIDKDIIIEKNVWIAAGVIILPGVTIGRNSVIAAGAVVNKDVPPYTIYGGVPAKFIKNIERN